MLSITSSRGRVRSLAASSSISSASSVGARITPSSSLATIRSLSHTSIPSRPRINRRISPLRLLIHLTPLLSLIALFTAPSPPATAYHPIALQSTHDNLAQLYTPFYQAPEHTAVTLRHGIHLHPLSLLLHRQITEHNCTRIIDFPCGSHTDITSPLLNLLHITDVLKRISYTCLDTNSRGLAEAHSTIRSTLPNFHAATFTRKPLQETQGDLLLAFRNRVENDTNALRKLLLDARVAGVRRAVVGGLPMGTRDWHPVGTLQSAPFPFSRGLLEARPYSKERFVLVYDLDVLPRASEVHVTVVREEKGNEGKTS